MFSDAIWDIILNKTRIKDWTAMLTIDIMCALHDKLNFGIIWRTAYCFYTVILLLAGIQLWCQKDPLGHLLRELLPRRQVLCSAREPRWRTSSTAGVTKVRTVMLFFSKWLRHLVQMWSLMGKKQVYRVSTSFHQNPAYFYGRLQFLQRFHGDELFCVIKRNNNNNNNAGVVLLHRLHQNEGEWVINTLWLEVAFTVYRERYWWWVGSLSFIGAIQTQVQNTCSD